MAPAYRTTPLPALTAVEATAVTELVDDAAVEDGFEALNEAGRLKLRHPGGDGTRHLLGQPVRSVPLEAGGELHGYAQLDPGAGFSTGQLVVAPTARRRGLGRLLLEELLTSAPTPLQVWAQGNGEAAQALAARAGLVAVRELLVMTRPLTGTLRTPRLPEGVSVRTFVPGQDEAAWLALNARAFAHHPEQGGVSAADLADRMTQPWFDPDGFFLAESTGPDGPRLVGYHWTKQHSSSLGEVYVLGVDPEAGGHGLGGALLDIGLAALRDRGLSEVELYVEGDAERAVRLYRGRGFEVASRDVMYSRP